MNKYDMTFEIGIQVRVVSPGKTSEAARKRAKKAAKAAVAEMVSRGCYGRVALPNDPPTVDSQVSVKAGRMQVHAYRSKRIK